MKGRGEWDRQSTNLKHSAEWYAPRFPFPTEPRPAVNDKETAATATAIATSAGRFNNYSTKTRPF